MPNRTCRLPMTKHPLSQIVERKDNLLAVTDGCGLALYFDWLGDRYGQRLYAVFNGAERLLAQSVEDSGSESTAGLQTFQDLSRQVIGEGELIFLVGLSGGDYWSCSVEILTSGRGFQWDLS